MRKTYPYLIDIYSDNKNISSKKLEFLHSIDKYVNQKQYVKITLLNWNEEPLKEIQGEVTGGSITKDGSSSVRRSGSITTTITSEKYDINDIRSDYSINKKVFVELGVENNSNQYEDYPILWFPQGVFFISGISANLAANGSMSITVTLKDKMLKLSGEIGGTFNAAMDLDVVDDTDDAGKITERKLLLYEIILELVNHWGGEPLNNIIIEDIDNDAYRLIKWAGSKPVYMYKQYDETTGINSYILSYEQLVGASGEIIVYAGTDIGYELTDFIYGETLSVNIGESVTAALDKIKNYLGNYEYFYDEFGIFHFQEIKNYVNKSQSTIDLNDMANKNYLLETYSPKSVYSFTNNNNIVQLSVTPNYTNIKNDYVITGTRTNQSNNIKSILMFHLAIENKPTTGNSYTNMIVYKYDNSKVDAEDRTVDSSYNAAAFPVDVGTSEDLPVVGVEDRVYRVNRNHMILVSSDYDEESYPILSILLSSELYKLETSDTISDYYFRWYDGEYKVVDPIAEYTDLQPYISKDWRVDIYLQTLQSRIDGTISSVSSDTIDTYGEELVSFFPATYDLINKKFYSGTYTNALSAGTESECLYDKDYFLDFIDPSDSIYGEFAIGNIGRRTLAANDENINCLFEPFIPDISYINTTNKSEEEIVEEKYKNISLGKQWAQVTDDYYKYFALGKGWNSAFERIRYELYLHTNYQKAVSITALPVFYLEPNVLTYIEDNHLNVKGDYLIKSIALTLGAGKTMTVSATECFSRNII